MIKWHDSISLVSYDACYLTYESDIAKSSWDHPQLQYLPAFSPVKDLFAEDESGFWYSESFVDIDELTASSSSSMPMVSRWDDYSLGDENICLHSRTFDWMLEDISVEPSRDLADCDIHGYVSESESEFESPDGFTGPSLDHDGLCDYISATSFDCKFQLEMDQLAQLLGELSVADVEDVTLAGSYEMDDSSATLTTGSESSLDAANRLKVHGGDFSVSMASTCALVPVRTSEPHVQGVPASPVSSISCTFSMSSRRTSSPSTVPAASAFTRSYMDKLPPRLRLSSSLPTKEISGSFWAHVSTITTESASIWASLPSMPSLQMLAPSLALEVD